MGPRVYELGHHKRCEKWDTTCESWYYFFAHYKTLQNNTIKVLKNVILQSFTGKPRTVLTKNFLQQMLPWEIFDV